jgi:hypothetical protein
MKILHVNKSAASILIISLCLLRIAFAETVQELQCPSILDVAVNKEKYKEWQVYANDPLRLSGAWITRSDGGHLDETPDPDRTEIIKDDNNTHVEIYYLHTLKKQFGMPWNLQCFYGEHVELTREIPKSLSECRVLRHQIWNSANNEPEFEAFCK